MSQLSAGDEVQLQSLLKQLLRSISDKISGAPSTECAEEILLHLEETDKNFHNYEFVRYLRQHVESSLGPVVEDELQNLTRGGQHAVGPGQDTSVQAVTRRTRDSAQCHQMLQTLKATMMVAVESLITKFDEDQLRKEEMHREIERCQSNSQFADNCSDSDSSFNQQLQVLAEKLDSSKPKEVRCEALQALCCAPPSDVLSCESWSTLRRNLCSALAEPDLSENVLQFFAKSFSSSPLNVTREIYTSLAKSLESAFLSQRLNFPTRSAAVDINSPQISRLLKQIRLMNDFQKEVTTFWIRHPEKYMEEIIESTFCLLSSHHDHGSTGTEKTLEPVHLLSILDIKATWFNKWMHGYYSRTVVLRLLERKYKTLVSDSVIQISSCYIITLWCNKLMTGLPQRGVFTRRDLEYSFFVHSLCILGKIIIYTNGRKLFPIKIRKHKGGTFGFLYTSILCISADMNRSLHSSDAATLFLPIPPLSGINPAATLILIADVLARIANTDRGLALFLYEKNLVVAHSEKTFAAHIVVQFTLRLLNKALPSLSESEASQTLCGAFIFVCRQMYNTCEGLQVLQTYGLHKAIAAAWKKVQLQHPISILQLNYRCEKFGYGVMVTQVAATAPGVAALHSSGFVRLLVVDLWSALECGGDDARVVRPKPTPMDSIDRSCLKVNAWTVPAQGTRNRQPLANKSEYSLREIPSSIPDLIDRLVAVDSDVKIHSLFQYEQSHTFGLRLLGVLCCCLDSFLLLESQYNICCTLLQSQRENVADRDATDGLSVERNHVLVRVHVVGGPSERRLPSRALEEGELPYSWPMFLSYPPPSCYVPALQIGAFLASSKEPRGEESWLEICRRHFCKAMKSKPNTLTGKGELLGPFGVVRSVVSNMAFIGAAVKRLFNLLVLLQVHVPQEVAESGISPVYWCTAHYVEMLLKAEVPLVHSAFRMSGFTPSQVCLHWLTQCFWNYLDWTEICQYICTCVVMGPDYQVYLCVAVFKHLEPEILERTQSQELQLFLKVKLQSRSIWFSADFHQRSLSLTNNVGFLNNFIA
uniref:Protein broad-minded n=1 Tax=Poecilia reticulata TaxID=8081 RepID=A0A3P9PVV4_POERE